MPDMKCLPALLRPTSRRRKKLCTASIATRVFRPTRRLTRRTSAAIFPRHSASKREGAVFYFHFTEKELLIFGGVWGPDRDELLAYRTLLAEQHEEFCQILSNKALRKRSLAACKANN